MPGFGAGFGGVEGSLKQCNLLFLVDASTSMKEKGKFGASFEIFVEAMEKILKIPLQSHSNYRLSVVFFWVDVWNRFKFEFIYQDLPFAEVDFGKLVKFALPDRAGTALDRGLKVAVQFLEGKEGDKTIKMVTDNPRDAQRVLEESMFGLFEKGIRLDCVIIGEKENEKPMLGTGNLGQVFQSVDVDVISKALIL